MAREREAKRYTGPAPFGFEWQGARLVANESQSAIRRRAFELFLELRLKGQVARILHEEGHRTPRGARILHEEGHRTPRGARIRDVNVDRWLICSSAIGEYAVNKTRKGKPLPPEEWTMVECEAIVDREVWDAVQRILTDGDGTDDPAPKKKKRVARPAGDALSPLVYCACGASMVVESSGGKLACRECGQRILREDLEAIVLEEVREYLSNRRDILQALVDKPGPVAEAEDRLLEHQERLKEVETKMSRIHELYLAGSIGTERFGKIHHPLEEEFTALKNKTPTLERELAEAQRDCPETESDELDVDGLVDSWSELPLETQRVILTELFEKVVVGDGEIHLLELLPTTPLRTPTNQQADSPTSATPTTSIDEPKYIRLPKQGTLCERTGLTRSMLNELILPTQRNDFRPPVKSFRLRKSGNIHGPRFIVWDSLKTYLEEQESNQ